jgi:hypothetical protein
METFLVFLWRLLYDSSSIGPPIVMVLCVCAGGAALLVLRVST